MAFSAKGIVPEKGDEFELRAHEGRTEGNEHRFFLHTSADTHRLKWSASASRERASIFKVISSVELPASALKELAALTTHDLSGARIVELQDTSSTPRGAPCRFATLVAVPLVGQMQNGMYGPQLFLGELSLKKWAHADKGGGAAVDFLPRDSLGDFEAFDIIGHSSHPQFIDPFRAPTSPHASLASDDCGGGNEDPLSFIPDIEIEQELRRRAEALKNMRLATASTEELEAALEMRSRAASVCGGDTPTAADVAGVVHDFSDFQACN